MFETNDPIPPSPARPPIAEIPPVVPPRELNDVLAAREPILLPLEYPGSPAKVVV